MSGPNGGRRVIAPMPPRDAGEAHRAATPLELLFDLVSVIAIAAAAAGLHHAIAEGHAIQGVLHFIIGFFAIWWAWMNYTWFASAYDNDDVVFRILTLVLMAGSLVMAAGIRDMVVSLDLTLAIAGYVVMRVAMVLFWLRAARHDPVRRKTALTYAAGVFLVQILWVGFGALQPLPEVWIYVLFAIGVVLELAVPVIAERMTATPWHRHHII
ncbi:MAG: low temperature requirement protein A, partial [Rhodobiaceae bacterium]|nr:low temperature requirement protein A [Rhodobiaceae bacterium]